MSFENIRKRVRPNSFLNYDLVITYERSTTDPERISGHFFEAFDYWLHLTTYTSANIAIVIPDDVPPQKIKAAYEDKYVIPDRDGAGYDFETIPIFVDDKYLNIIAKKILHCSGYAKGEEVSYFGEIISFRCGKEPADDDYLLLQDTRVYSNVPNKPTIIHYPKKIPFEFYRRYKSKADPRILIYDNTKSRELSPEEIAVLISEKPKKEFLIVGSDVKLPVKDFMLRFDEYWYTPTAKNFDCSPRLIAECAFFNKPVKYLVPEGYFDIDRGLFFRRHDIMDNFMNVVLAEGDKISEFLGFIDASEIR